MNQNYAGDADSDNIKNTRKSNSIAKETQLGMNIYW